MGEAYGIAKEYLSSAGQNALRDTAAPVLYRGKVKMKRTKTSQTEAKP